MGSITLLCIISGVMIFIYTKSKILDNKLKRNLLIGSSIFFLVAVTVSTWLSWFLYYDKDSNNTPTQTPTQTPTASPTASPTPTPTDAPTAAPRVPTAAPTHSPSYTQAPTQEPTQAPTAAPTTQAPINVESYCDRVGTYYDRDSGTCKINKVAVSALKPEMDQLISTQNIVPSSENQGSPILYIPTGENITSNRQNDPLPEWFLRWVQGSGAEDDSGGNTCNKQLSTVIERNKGIGCECGDCAAWRGGTSMGCGGELIEEPSYNNRVDCKLGRDSASNACVCASGYCPQGGLCVAPFKTNPSGKIGCPSCIYTKVSEGGCAGTLQCDPTESPQENIVSYPGKRYDCGQNLPSNFDEQDTATYNMNFQDQAEMDNACTLDNEYRNVNEYKCAYECIRKYDNQQECSKKCLPKLYTWGKVTVGGEFKGYYQTPVYSQFAPSEYELNTCPQGICNENDTNTLRPDQIVNCKGCTDCEWKYNQPLNSYEYVCGQCDSCTAPEGNISSNVENCRLCKKTFNLSSGGNNYIECEYCNPPQPIQSSVLPNDNMENPPPSQLVLYNKGTNYNPINYNVNTEEIGFCRDYQTNVGGMETNTTCYGNNTINKGVNDGGIEWYGSIYSSLEASEGECNTTIYRCNTRI